MKHQCDQTTLDEKVFEYRRGELSEVDRVQFEAELEACSSCAARIHSLIDALDTAADHAETPEIWFPEENMPEVRDRIFDAILDELDEPPISLEPDIEEDQKSDVQKEEPAQVSFVWTLQKLAAVLVVLLGLVVAFLVGRSSVETVQLVETPEASKIPEKTEPSLHLVPGPQELDVYASSDARWNLSEGPDYKIEVEEGTVLVDFLPTNGASLQVKAGNLEGHVTGTVFTLSPENGGTLSVFAGSVQVEGEPSPITTSMQVVAGQKPGMMPEAFAQKYQQVVNLKKHNALRALIAKTKAKSEPSPGSKSPDALVVRIKSAAEQTFVVEPKRSPGRISPDRASRRRVAPKKRQNTRPKAQTLTKIQPQGLQRTNKEADAQPEVSKIAPEKTEEPKKVTPEKPIEHRKLARAALKRRDFNLATRHYGLALKQEPESSRAAIHLELGRLYLGRLGQKKRG